MRITKREKNVFFNEQCKEVAEKNRMRKTKDLFKKNGYIKGVFQARMGTTKDRNGNDLTEAEKIWKRWQEYTELYRKDLNDQDNCDGVITHLEPDLLGCDVKWALGSTVMNKASGGDEIPAELFQILNAVKVLHSICQQIWKNSAITTALEKISFYSISKKDNAKNVQNTRQLHSFYIIVRLFSKSFKLGFCCNEPRTPRCARWV